MRLYIAHWYGPDKTFRVAGVYTSWKSAEQRIDELGAGSIQQVTLGKPVIFTHESPEGSAK